MFDIQQQIQIKKLNQIQYTTQLNKKNWIVFKNMTNIKKLTIINTNCYV